jgi:hypothetical protein
MKVIFLRTAYFLPRLSLFLLPTGLHFSTSVLKKMNLRILGFTKQKWKYIITRNYHLVPEERAHLSSGLQINASL